MYDLIIIGSGPAGLSAAVYARRAGLSTMVIEKSAVSGGQVLSTYEVDNYLGMPGINGYDLGMKFREHADRMGADFKEAEVMGVEAVHNTLSAAEVSACQKKEEFCHRVETDKGIFEARAVLIATGASHSKLGVLGEEELTGMGVSYCATCDGAFFRNKTVAVVGGGDVAVEDAIFLARTCTKVYLIHRRQELRAAKILQENLMQQKNIEILWDTVVEEIRGVSRVEELRVHNRATKKEAILAVDGIFIAVGIMPNTEVFKGTADFDEKGYILASEDGVTSQKGIFAAGDVRTKKLRQVITAVSDGANAITSIQEYFINNLS